jgi:hypothetical protein
MSSLSNILEDFRKSLHNDLDIAFNRGSQNLLTHLVDKLVSDNLRQTEVFIHAINDLKKHISGGGSVQIPEVYHTDVKLVDIITYKADEPDTKEIVEEEVDETKSDETEAVDEEQEEEGEAEEVETVKEEDVGEVEELATVQEEDVGEAEEEAEEEALQEIEVDGTTYYYDSEGNVFTLTEEGVPCDEPVGKYDMESGEFGLFASEESETLEEFEHKGKTYYKDSEGNVYNASSEPLPYTFTNGRFTRKA